MKNLNKFLIAGSVLALVLLGVIIYLVATNVIGPTGNAISILVPIAPEVDSLEAPAIIFIGLTTVPLDLSKNQGVMNNVVITFSEAMNPLTVNKDTFTITGPYNKVIDGVITSDSTKKIWTFNPVSSLKFNTLYNLKVTTEAKGVSGNALVKNFLWSFTTSYGSGGGSSGGTSDGGTTPVVPVVIPVLTTITSTPITASLLVGTTKQLTAIGLDQNNNSFATTIFYNTSNSSVATVNSSGFVTAIALGNATITSFNGTVNDTTLISVIELTGCPVVSVDLGTAGDFAVLSKAGISTTGVTSIVGDMGVSPIDSTAITGFGLIMDASNTFSTSSLVVAPGKIYAPDYIGPPSTTEPKMTTAIGDMGTAYTTANGLAACVNELGAGDIGGMTLAPGVYKWGTDLNIPTDVTLSGSATDVWVFQIAGKLDLAPAKHITLIGGAQAKNVYWIVGDTTTLGTTSVFNGNIVDQTNIALLTGATLNGRALAQTAVTLDANAVTIQN